MNYLDQKHLDRVKRFPGTRGGSESGNPYIRNILKKGNMKKITIEATNITPKQWANLVLELNLIRKQWKPYADIKLQGTGIKKIINYGTNTSSVSFVTKMGLKDR